MVRAAALSVVAWSCFSAGCFDASSSTAATSYPTTITVQPAAFLGAIACGGTGLHRYVVTLSDVTRGDAAAIAVTSAPPTACTLPTSFSLDKAVGHAFTAAIDGYDREDIVPAAPGSREMHDIVTGAVVCPTWQTSCGEDDAAGGNPLRKPTVVVELTETFMTGCAPLTSASAACGSATDLDASLSDVSDVDVPDATAERGAAASGIWDGSVEPYAIPRVDDSGDAPTDSSAQVLDDATREGG